jgi:shikimate kinase
MDTVNKEKAMKNIILTGFMGTGKTAVGKELVRLLEMRLIDADTEIEKAEKMSINEIFKQFGEQKFREIETETIKTISRNRNVIISTGGGAVLRQENMDALRENGIIICLTATPETILQRTSNSNDRPLLRVEDPFEKIKGLLDFRKPFYEKADIVVDTEGKTPLQIAEEVIEKVRKWKR